MSERLKYALNFKKVGNYLSSFLYNPPRERSNYSLNGVYRCENFAEHLTNNDFTPEPIGSAGGFRDWTITISTDSEDDRVVYPFIQSDNFNKASTIKFLFAVIKKDGSTSFLETDSEHFDRDEGPRGDDWDILELLDEKNGYLDDGALMIEYGIQVESVLGKDKIWRFNIENPLFDCQQKKQMIQIFGVEFSIFRVHKQLLTFHSPYFKRSCEEDGGNFEEITSEENRFYELENFLQICQGVHVKKLNERSLARIMNIARYYSMQNVIHYCERQLMETDLKFSHMKGWFIHWDGLRHYLVHLLKKVKSPRKLIKKKDIKKMKGETMKIFVAEFLYDNF